MCGYVVWYKAPNKQTISFFYYDFYWISFPKKKIRHTPDLQYSEIYQNKTGIYILDNPPL